MSEINLKEKVDTELRYAIEAVENIHQVLEDHPDELNGHEAKYISGALECFIEKFKLEKIAYSCESIIGNKDASLKYCKSVITSLESRLERLAII